MTDKAAVEVPAPVTGRVVNINGQPGDMIRVGAELIVFETESNAPASLDEPWPQSPRSRRLLRTSSQRRVRRRRLPFQPTVVRRRRRQIRANPPAPTAASGCRTSDASGSAAARSAGSNAERTCDGSGQGLTGDATQGTRSGHRPAPRARLGPERPHHAAGFRGRAQQRRRRCAARKARRAPAASIARAAHGCRRSQGHRRAAPDCTAHVGCRAQHSAFLVRRGSRRHRTRIAARHLNSKAGEGRAVR